MYCLWHPRLTSNVDVEATLTAGESFSLGNPGREFFEGLLEALHVNTRLERSNDASPRGVNFTTRMEVDGGDVGKLKIVDANFT
jgi:hypothetical protein